MARQRTAPTSSHHVSAFRPVVGCPSRRRGRLGRLAIGGAVVFAGSLGVTAIANAEPAHALCFNLPNNSTFCGPTAQPNFMGNPIDGSKAYGVTFTYHFG